MQTVKDILFDVVEGIVEVRHVKGQIYPMCKTHSGISFQCTKVEGKDWDYESLPQIDKD